MEKKVEKLISDIQMIVKELIDLKVPICVFENIVDGIMFDVNNKKELEEEWSFDEYKRL